MDAVTGPGEPDQVELIDDAPPPDPVYISPIPPSPPPPTPINGPPDPALPQAPPPPTLGQLINPDLYQGILHAFGCKVEHIFDRGLRCSPVAGPPPAPPVSSGGGAPVPGSSPPVHQVAFWRTHGGTCKKIITWIVQMIGAKPPIPNPDTGSGNDVLMDVQILADIPPVSPDGSQVHTIAGRFIYMLQVTPGPADSLPSGQHPLSTVPPAANQINPADFVSILGKAGVTNYDGSVITF